MKVFVTGANKRRVDRNERLREVGFIAESSDGEMGAFTPDATETNEYVNIDRLFKSDCVVAEVDNEEPSVMFELGVAFATNKVMEDIQRAVKDYYLKNQDNKGLRDALYDFAINLKKDVLDKYPEKKVLTHISDERADATDEELLLPSSDMSPYLKLFGSMNRSAEEAIGKI